MAAPNHLEPRGSRQPRSPRPPDPRFRRFERLGIAVGLALTLVTAGCSSSDGQSASGPADATDTLGADAAEATFTARASLEQVAVTGAPKQAGIALFDSSDDPVATGTTDEAGSYLFRDVDPARGYRVATTGDDPTASPPLEVKAVDGSVPEQSFYDGQVLQPGFNYITTRDGTTLSASVYLPGPAEDGPYPTVVEYSGYDPSRPGSNLLEENEEALKSTGVEDPNTLCPLLPFACDAPAQPASILATAFGYAVVAVNIRGTGCSGGAYDFFEPLQLTDGYDIVETAAAQPWVTNHRVGMVGLSYPGISQLFVASQQPPSLAAITPLSVYDDTARGVLAPGGIFNEGFALQWAENVLDDAEPYGQGWEKDRAAEEKKAGATTCADNQLLRGQNVDAVAKAQQYPYYEPSVADPLSPTLFADDIRVPVFLTGAFQDEQTGGRFPLLFDKFTNAPVTHFSAWNGAHADGFAPFNLVEWKTFLDLYVGDRISPVPGAVSLFLPALFKEIFDTQLTIPPQRFLDEPNAAAARVKYEAEPRIRLALESGAGDPDRPGAPVPTTDVRVTSWPPPGTTGQTWYLQADGTLGTVAPSGTGGSASRFDFDAELATATTFAGDDANDLFEALPDYDWEQEPSGSAAVFVSPPLTTDSVMVGSASADLWIRTNADDADLGVTLSEVRPDGDETYIQSGILRASNRKVASGSTELLPLHTELEADAEPVPDGEFVEARVEILPFGHIVRAGSRLRISVHTPGGDKPRWSYIPKDYPDGTYVDVAHSTEHPSKVVLPATPGITGYPSTLPACPGLRGQPCRSFEEYTNTSAD